MDSELTVARSSRDDQFWVTISVQPTGAGHQVLTPRVAMTLKRIKCLARSRYFSSASSTSPGAEIQIPAHLEVSSPVGLVLGGMFVVASAWVREERQPCGRKGETQPIGKPKVQNSRKFKGC
ncbi:Diphosphomevalonate Decarboxylase [Manis pentadactyla]|nr:Diphosphomevalonate Decarboxylase [Manis pentadactyla]